LLTYSSIDHSAQESIKERDLPRSGGDFECFLSGRWHGEPGSSDGAATTALDVIDQ
jgi:hypothetical protein